MDKVQIEIWDALCELSGEEVARLFTNYYGNQLLTEDFKEWLEEEGVMYNLECPLGGDETNDCADCAYAGDYHFVNGECVRREEEE